MDKQEKGTPKDTIFFIVVQTPGYCNQIVNEFEQNYELIASNAHH